MPIIGGRGGMPIIGGIMPTYGKSKMVVGGIRKPRGGIPIDIFYQTGEPPKGVWIPDQGVANYRGRG